MRSVLDFALRERTEDGAIQLKREEIRFLNGRTCE